jgi:hypothetical protein
MPDSTPAAVLVMPPTIFATPDPVLLTTLAAGGLTG